MKNYQQIGVFLLIAVYLPISLSQFVKTDQTQIISILNESCYAANDQGYGTNEVERVQKRIEEIKQLFPASNIPLNNIRVVKSTDLYSIFTDDQKKQSYLAIRGTQLHAKDFQNETLMGLENIPSQMSAINVAMNNEMKDLANQGYLINVSGHSFGANLALLACADNAWVNHCEVHNPFLNDKLVEKLNSAFISREMNKQVFIQVTYGDWASQLFATKLINVTYSVFNQVSSVQGLSNHSSLTLFGKVILEGNQFWNFNETNYSKPLTKQDEMNIGTQYFELMEQIFNAIAKCKKQQYFNFNQKTCINCPSLQTCTDRFLGPSFCSSSEEISGGQCQKCDKGYYGIGVGKNKCQECPSGSKCNNGVRIFCEPGTQNKYTGQTKCDQCPNGFYSSSQGAINCKGCPKGHKCPIKSEEPIPCPFGTFQQYAEQSKCTDCANGQYSLTLGSLKCIDCPKGHYCLNKSKEPTPCQPGTFNQYTEQTKCDECSTGYYSTGFGAISCIACPKGHYCPSKINEPIPCQPGQFNQYSASTTCLECYQGTYQPNTGASNCITCPPGTYSNSKGQTDCEPKNFLSA